MIYYNWNQDRFDDWYDNIEENKVKTGIELSKKAKKKLKEEIIQSVGDYCLICQELKQKDNFLSLNCKHQFYIRCWKAYLKEKIKYPLKALYAKCPQYECTCIFFEKLY